jgi:nucleotide-binding universal stress UspA family protein
MKTIVVPTDFSVQSNNALAYALSIARLAGAGIILLHAYHRPSSNTTAFRDITPILRQDAEVALQKLLKHIQQEPASEGIPIETQARKGDLVHELKKITAERKADLIVMGTKGASGLAEVLIGTNTASVIEDAACPVLAIPEGAVFRQIRQIVYATDYLATENESIGELTKFAALFQASVVLVHIAGNVSGLSQQDHLMEDYSRKIKQQIAYPHLSFYLEKNTDTLQGLTHTIDSLQADLAAMTTRKRNIYEKIFNPSITKKMAYHTHIPLLAFHA